ncbi:uncharacterized protein K452DRAFT_322311 [Aplosporella prunicola CBS 121167]|uniref:Enterotoxin n=1 Tax=Aplosporella prunicola CBS 121167 TaxID=1176127 RepID=A0A6A6AZH7_9PEZI|nr:uncharacterized protein K452DRAFT_322311 [Aplosporella prunicola CBS 121167]KAF2136593.1 hypothetical protein K452DRAFT_322311 [Aplosporella prunicola CBS 121167]
MLFPTTQLITLALTLAGSVAAVPAKKPTATPTTQALKTNAPQPDPLIVTEPNVRVVGYRTLNAVAAQEYNKKGTITKDKRPESHRAGSQIGLGTYIMRKIGDYNVPGQNDWICVIWANQEKFIRAKKAFIPQYQGKDQGRDKEIWFHEEKITEFIKGFNFDPSQTLRLSEIDGGDVPHAMQMAIPDKMLNSRIGKNKLDLGARCKPVADLRNIDQYPAADYTETSLGCWQKSSGEQACR